MTAAGDYRGRRPFKGLFWLRFAYETLGPRRVRAVVAARLRTETVKASRALDLLPEGAFILAVNHYSGRAAFDTAAAVLSALADARPDAVERMLIVVGKREYTRGNRFQRGVYRLSQWIVGHIFRRWRAHVLRIPLGNLQPDAAGLREWRIRNQPALVFPEGKAGLSFGAIRPGAGRWLAALNLPVVPVGVWWRQGEGWSIRFGAPLVWTHRRDLRDLQLGLAIAALLPEALASGWQADLYRWRAAHQAS